MTSKPVEESIVPKDASLEEMFDRFGSGLKIVGIPEKCVEHTKSLCKKFTEALDKVLVEGKDELKTEIQTSVSSEFDGKAMNVNIARILNPLTYALHFHEEYMGRVPKNTKILFVGMNPSTESLTGVPFYEAEVMAKLFEEPSADDLIKNMPAKYQGKETSESGKRFWKFVLKEFGSYDKFFRHCFVINYSPLIFMNKDGINVALDGFNNSSDPLLKSLMAISDSGMKDIINEMKPTLIIAIGNYAFRRVNQVNTNIKCYKILHPSPRSGQTADGWMTAVGNFLKRNAYWRQAMEQIENEEKVTREKRDRPE